MLKAGINIGEINEEVERPLSGVGNTTQASTHVGKS